MRLYINIDHVATVRQARKAPEPEPVAAAVLAELAGADGITVHLRGDRRHIQERDVELLCATITTRLNVEMAATREMVGIALRVGPHQVTLVPERANELTTTGGLDVVRRLVSVEKVVKQLHAAGIATSLFIDADVRQVKAAAAAGATAIEINTGPYADAPIDTKPLVRDKVIRAARAGVRQRLDVLAGHGLTYRNVQSIVAIDEIAELNIGHSIVSRSVLVGMERAVVEMIDLLRR